ncbi:ABC transporter ATP-binding protein [Vagococcus carniphilus]|uniref:ABC transporter ATP-binding protein n=1 Tax=Vagococcus carniphilus TaxID=218144 RepID=A0AAW8U633_9ENTE|nr:ABC transporter ATP-binding protein [Vagococcus carniphilus]MDT2829357.1 ABC transporter ATP-binding protein [Vagococcus carniphilus]MDT2833436.1 ABC transporter ATP-binding protein [Vagococcus carniphilus]MDT2838816.1 ABC transporter ATP-binding protein [Vagococcus carniphilus]MDT2852874.1 ABC transporter ATP-binding protein [Vagococcus carniphilus]
MMIEKNILEVKNISLSYQKDPIVKELDVSFMKGKISVIIGPNGCGKSTLLKGISRLLKKETGSIILNDTNMDELSNKEIAKQLAFLPQSATAPEDVTVRDVVELGRYPYRKVLQKVSQEEKIIVDEVLQQTVLFHLRDENINNLSGGQKQRVWIAMALAQKTEIILLDEPTTYLDLGHQIEVLNLLKELNETTGQTIIMVLHDLNLASRFSDYMIGMKNGRVVYEGVPTEMMTPTILKDLFGIEAYIGEDPVDKKPICLRFD